MVTEESTKDTVKTIVQGMPAVAVYPWLLTRVLFAARGLGCNAHPAFPAPSSDLRAARFQQLGHFVPRECGLVSAVMSRPILRDAAYRPLPRTRSFMWHELRPSW